MEPERPKTALPKLNMDKLDKNEEKIEGMKKKVTYVQVPSI